MRYLWNFLRLVVEIIQNFCPPVAKQINYLTDLQQNVDTLMRETEALKCKRKDIGSSVQESARKRQKMLHQVENWLVAAANTEAEVDLIKSEFDERRTIMNGRCTDYFSRYMLGKRAIKKLDEVKDLIEKGTFDRLSAGPSSPPPAKAAEMPMISMRGQRTSEQTLKKMQHYLHDEETGIICVYGIGGVGKTTLMRSINNGLVGTHDFEAVIWVTVSKDGNSGRIQKEIGKKLGLNFRNNETEEEKRMELFTALKNTRYMLIFDDIWQEICLEGVGIPKPNKQNRCNIIITTRIIQVGNVMEADVQIRVNTLTRKEGWDLFCDKAGDVVLLPDIRALAEDVADECSGLPLAITTVGRAMRGKDMKELWMNALRALRGSAPEIEGMEPKVFLSLKLSYDHLEDKNIKHCFLYCSLYPEDHDIPVDKLVMYWVMEGFIDNVDYLSDASIKGHHIIERITDACLLEKKCNQRYQIHSVKMHDLIRDMAIWITSAKSNEGPRFLVRAGVGLKEPPTENMWKDKVRISLMNNDIEELPVRPDCPKLVTLLLRNNYSLTIIPNSFFELMAKLAVLDLSHTSIKSLPVSLSSLVNLRSLLLCYCLRLEELVPIGGLKELQFLNLSWSGIKKLPEDLGKLFKLKQLDLSHLHQLKTIPQNTICRLSALEELHLFNTCGNLAKKEVPEEEDACEAILGEVATLRHLTTLVITLQSIDCRAYDVFHCRWASLRKFHFHIGTSYMETLVFPSSNKEVTINGCDHFPHGIKVMLKHVKHLHLWHCKGLKCISQLVEDSNSLVELDIRDCSEMDLVIGWREVRDVGALQSLGSLVLRDLPNLKKVFEGQAPRGSFQKLRLIHVESCHKLRNLFSSDMVEHLHQLEELQIQKCDEMEQINEGDMLPYNAFPRLRHLVLMELAELTSVASSGDLGFTSLQELRVSSCPKLRKLPFFLNIEKIKGEKHWWEGLEWEDENNKNLFQSKFCAL